MLWILTVMFLWQRPIGQVGGSPLREKLKWICEHYGPWKGSQESFGASDVYEEGIRRDRGSTVLSPLTITFDTSGHVKCHPESLHGPNRSKYVVMVEDPGSGCVENYHFLVQTTHFDDEDSLL